jgi:hypothetical protein
MQYAMLPIIFFTLTYNPVKIRIAPEEKDVAMAEVNTISDAFMHDLDLARTEESLRIYKFEGERQRRIGDVKGWAGKPKKVGQKKLKKLNKFLFFIKLSQ